MLECPTDISQVWTDSTITPPLRHQICYFNQRLMADSARRRMLENKLSSSSFFLMRRTVGRRRWDSKGHCRSKDTAGGLVSKEAISLKRPRSGT